MTRFWNRVHDMAPRWRDAGCACRRALCDLRDDEAGVSAIVIGVTLSALIGFGALATEVSGWYVVKRSMQGAADAAAYGAATALGGGAPKAVFVSQAKSIAGADGFVDGSNGVTVTVNNPPISNNASLANNTKAVEVIIARPQQIALASFFLASGPTIRAAAIAGWSGSGCVLALSQSASAGLSTTGSAAATLSNCNLDVNSSSGQALSLVGNSTITANAAYVVGGDSIAGRASLTTTNGTHLGAGVTADPYAGVAVPSYSGCNQTNYALSGHATQTLTPGSSGIMVFCQGFSIAGGSTVTLNPGIYIINGGSFSISGNSTITGTDVTIVLTGSGSNYATVSIAGGSTVTLSAPTTGATAGLAFFQDPRAPASGSDSFSGGATQNITGAIYFPNQSVTYSGGTSTGSAVCTQLIASTITFAGNAVFNSACVDTGVKTIGGSPVRLLE